MPIVRKADRIEIERGRDHAVIDAAQRVNDSGILFIKTDRNLVPACL